jgi:hypothetical protein
MLTRVAGFAILVLQLAFFAVARFAPGRQIHTTPCEGQTHYRLFATTAESSLDESRLRRRYRLGRGDLVALTPEGVRTIIRSRESAAFAPGATGAAREPVYVRLHTRHDGAAQEIWLWPEN